MKTYPNKPKINILSTHLLFSLSPKMSMAILSPPDRKGNVTGRKLSKKKAAVLTDYSYNLNFTNFT